jgi:hypothetical protein
VRQLVPGALGIALMSFTDDRGRPRLRGGDPPIDAGRELVATGAANLGRAVRLDAGGGGTSQTAVVRSVGGRVRWHRSRRPPRRW